MSLTLYHVDAFTGRPFAGNPAAVCVLPVPRDASWMQAVAREMNLSETAFLFVSRFFAPAFGIPEDPVTGSAHCCLGPFWHRRLGKAELVGYQASARGGVVHVQVAGDRVHLAGEAVTVLRSEWIAGA